MAFVAFGWILWLTTPYAVELLVCIGVVGCGWPISSSVVRWGTACLALMNNAPNSNSAAEDMTALIICEIFKTARLFAGILSFIERK